MLMDSGPVQYSPSMMGWSNQCVDVLLCRVRWRVSLPRTVVVKWMTWRGRGEEGERGWRGRRGSSVGFSFLSTVSHLAYLFLRYLFNAYSSEGHSERGTPLNFTGQFLIANVMAKLLWVEIDIKNNLLWEKSQHEDSDGGWDTVLLTSIPGDMYPSAGAMEKSGANFSVCHLKLQQDWRRTKCKWRWQSSGGEHLCENPHVTLLPPSLPCSDIPCVHHEYSARTLAVQHHSSKGDMVTVKLDLNPMTWAPHHKQWLRHTKTLHDDLRQETQVL